MSRALLTASFLALILSACSRPPPPPTSPAVSPPASPTTPQAAPAVSAPAAVPGTEAAPATAPVTALAPAAEEPDEPGAASLSKLAALSPEQQLPGGRWVAGTHYIPIVPPQPTSVSAGKVEVMEVFWFGCPHCYALEPEIARWLKSKPKYEEFVRVPVMWGPVHRGHAHLFYTLQALGHDDLDGKVFTTIHEDHNLLVGNTDEETLAAQMAFAKANGLDPEAFRKAWSSFGVNASLQRAQEITDRYQVDGVPLVIVNGKYSTDVGKAGDEAKLFALINDLAAFEHQRH